MSHADHLVAIRGEDTDIGAYSDHHWRANKDTEHRLGKQCRQDGVFETVHLGAKGVAANRHIQQPKGELIRSPVDLVGHQDHAHARAPNRHTHGHSLANRLVHSEALGQEPDGRAFSPWNDEPVDLGELFGGSNRNAAKVGIHHGERLEVTLEIALNREHADRLAHVGTLYLRGREYPSPVIELIGAPFDLCGRRRGSRLGPAALRLAGLEKWLRDLNLETHDTGDVAVADPLSELTGLEALEPCVNVTRSLKVAVLRSLEAGRTPLVLGGDHSIAMGSVAAALEFAGRSPAVLWIDAHADINTPSTSPSGNLHGMTLSALTHLPEPANGTHSHAWNRLVAEVIGPQALDANRIGWLGLREVDPEESRRIRSFPHSFVATMTDIDRDGIARIVARLVDWLDRSGAEDLWISFDVDALDPGLAPGTGTAVRGGLTYREAHFAAEMLHQAMSREKCPWRLLGLDVVEANPLIDWENGTSRMAVEWVASLFGKRIL